MKIPEKIVGKNKIRDASICNDWEYLIDDENYPQKKDILQELSERYGFTERYIYKIVRRNHAYMPLDKEWEKRKRISRLRMEAKQSGKSQKDIVDILDALRKEMKDDKPLINNNIHNTYQQVKVVIDDNSRISSALKSRVNSTRPKQV